MKPSSIRTGFFILLVALTTLAFFGLIRSFLMPMFWAVVLAVIFQPVHKWWLLKVAGRPSLASILTMLTILLGLILPLTLFGLALSREALSLYQDIATGELDLAAPIRRVQELLPMVVEYLDRYGLELDRLQEWLSGIAGTTSSWMAQQALAMGQDALRITLMFALMLYVLFFFLRDGRAILDGVIRALPLSDEREWTLLRKFASVSRATIGGALVVAAVQGTLGGIAFWALGIPAPVFWGAVMTVLSFLPAVGASLIWGPAAVILLIIGSPVRALILVIVGALLIGIIDNILRPILVGRYTEMPDFLILISTLGGLAVFGLSGVIIGPVVAAFFLAVWEMFAREHEKEEVGAGDA